MKIAATRRGFTLIEMITVTVIISVLASIILGRLQVERGTVQFQKGIQGIESAANKARNRAIQTGQTQELTFDSASQSLQVATADPNADSSSNSTNATNSAQDQPSQALGTGWTVYEVHQPDGSTTTDLSIKFFADGTAESKSVEFHAGGAPVSLEVKQNGSIEVSRGALSEQQIQEWEAGNIEQRSNL